MVRGLAEWSRWQSGSGPPTCETFDEHTFAALWLSQASACDG